MAFLVKNSARCGGVGRCAPKLPIMKWAKASYVCGTKTNIAVHGEKALTLQMKVVIVNLSQ